MDDDVEADVRCRHIRRAAIIDDHPAIQATLAEFLQEFKIETEVWPTGIAPGLLEAFDPDLILLDIQLGVSDAFTILRSQIPPTYRGVVSIVSGQGIDIVMDANLLGERLGLRMGMPVLKPFSFADIRDLVSVADQHLERRSIGELALKEQEVRPSHELRLRQALDEALLEVWYQPKFTAATGRVSGAEALIRGRGPGGEIISPHVLLSDADKQDMHRLADFTLISAIAHSRELAAVGFHERLSANVPVSYLTDQSDPCRIVRQAHLSADWPGMVFEITEDEALNDVIEMQMIATQLHLYGVTLSIDDFGSAYSSLSRLRDLPFKELKLDRSFVSNCAIDSTRRAICTHVFALGTELGVTTVAEGVETEAEFRFLNELGFNQVQGFLFARPMPFQDLLKFIKAHYQTFSALPGPGGPPGTVSLLAGKGVG